MSLTLKQAQQIVVEHEAEYWESDAKDEPNYTRHTLEHLCKSIGKLGNLVEPREHGLKPSTNTVVDEVIPDLLYFCLGLANAHQVDVEKLFPLRLEANKKKIDNRRRGILETPSA